METLFGEYRTLFDICSEPQTSYWTQKLSPRDADITRNRLTHSKGEGPLCVYCIICPKTTLSENLKYTHPPPRYLQHNPYSFHFLHGTEFSICDEWLLLFIQLTQPPLAMIAIFVEFSFACTKTFVCHFATVVCVSTFFPGTSSTHPAAAS